MGPLLQRHVALYAAVVVVLAGCGRGRPVSGPQVFAHACATCHTLTGHDTQIDGGDLAVGRLTVREIESFTRVMPVRHPLTAAEVRAVARYIEATARAQR